MPELETVEENGTARRTPLRLTADAIEKGDLQFRQLVLWLQAELFQNGGNKTIPEFKVRRLNLIAKLDTTHDTLGMGWSRIQFKRQIDAPAQN